MDTREKILTWQAALEQVNRCRAEGRPVRIVTGHFDVLLPDHIRVLRNVRDGTAGALVLAVITPPREPVLGERARAEMVAAIRMIDYVVTAGIQDAEQIVSVFQPAEITRLEAADEALAQRLIDHVHRRQTG